MADQLGGPPSSNFEARVINLEAEHLTFREDLGRLKEMHHALYSSVHSLQKGGRPITVDPLQTGDLTHSHQIALRLRQELEEISCDVHKSVDIAGVEMTDMAVTPNASSIASLHLRTPSGGTDNTSGSYSLPPHLRKNCQNAQGNMTIMTPSENPLVTNAHAGTTTMAMIPAPLPSPPSSPVTNVRQSLSVNKLPLLTAWKPHFLTTLSPLQIDTKIPAEMVTFHPQFLEEVLGGTDWSPGLRFVTGKSTCILKNRTYYMMDPTTEPYLPEQPGQHGAKLTAFFNVNPEEVHENLPDGVKSYEYVPLFVENPGTGRYVYYGHYSQTRWSDRLDHDTMTTRVPQQVKDFWAAELTSPIRQEWITQELKKHFFPMPTYEGRIYAAADPDTATDMDEDEVKISDRMAKNMRKYVTELREWEREANMKTAMMKKQFILDAFEAADADMPPALRLWWEYLECVDWRKDFYDLLSTLQSRNASFNE